MVLYQQFHLCIAAIAWVWLVVSNSLFAEQQQTFCRVTLGFVSAEQRTFCMSPTAFFTSTYLAPYDTHPAYMAGYTPHTHLRRLCKLIDWSSASKLDMPGQWVYMVWTVSDPRPYFGQCGAIGGPKTVIQRFTEQVTAAQSCTVVYGNKRRLVPLFIYLLRKLGTHAFWVVPVRRTTVSNTDHVEIWHIRNSVPNMNTNHTKRGQYYPWLARGNIRKCLPPTDIQSESR